MAVLFVTEFGRQSHGVAVDIPTPQVPELAAQTVAIGAGSVQSAAFAAGTRLVRIHTDAICSIAFGVNPTALATSMRLAAGTTEYFAVVGGQKVAVITNT